MIIPLGTERSLARPTLVIYILVAVNVAAFLAQAIGWRLAPAATESAIRALWLDPRAITPWGLFSYAFIHADFLHILGNMVFLWVFGPNVEDRFGRLRFLAFFLVGGLVAGAVHCVFEDAPVVGASGAISAVTGAFLVLFPRTHVRCFVIFFIIGIFHVPAWYVIGLAIAWDFFSQGLGSADSIARLAHIGGYATGAGLSVALLWLRALPREPFDLFTMGRQAYRRRKFKEISAEMQSAGRRAAAAPLSPAEQERRDRLAAARARVVELLARHNLHDAGAAYRELVNDYGESRSAVLLSSRHQLDLANHFFAQEDFQSAAYCYETFLSAYRGDSEAPRVRLMLGLINARYLNDPVRAKQALADLPPALHDPDQRRLAETLIEELA